eukprot:1914473-Heterocapsa_arctica.AAC.1
MSVTVPVKSLQMEQSADQCLGRPAGSFKGTDILRGPVASSVRACCPGSLLGRSRAVLLSRLLWMRSSISGSLGSSYLR